MWDDDARLRWVRTGGVGSGCAAGFFSMMFYLFICNFSVSASTGGLQQGAVGGGGGGRRRHANNYPSGLFQQ